MFSVGNFDNQRIREDSPILLFHHLSHSTVTLMGLQDRGESIGPSCVVMMSWFHCNLSFMHGFAFQTQTDLFALS